MDTRINAGGSRFDVISTDTASRVTPRSGVAFRDFVSRSASAIVRGAEAAVTSLPGAPIVAAAVRPGPSVPVNTAIPGMRIDASPRLGADAFGTAESPVGGVASEAPSIEQTLAQSQGFNLYFLQLQEQIAAENRAYTAMSNVLKARHDTVKNAIGNIR